MTKPPSPRPLSIKVISILHIVTAAVSIFLLSGPHASYNMFFGFIISGLIASVVMLGWVCLDTIVAIGLWRLNERGRQLAIAVSSYSILESFLYAANPSSRSTQLLELTSNGSSITEAWVIVVGTAITEVAVFATIIYFLIKRKSAFVKLTNG